MIRSKAQKSVIMTIVCIVVIYLIFTHFYIYQSDAYVETNVSKVTPIVSGPITHVAVKDLTAVKKGQVLFQIEEKPYLYAKQKALGELQLAEEMQQQLQMKKKQYMAALQSAKQDMLYEKKSLQRYQNNAAYTSKEEIAAIKNKYLQKTSKVKQLEEKIAQINAQLGPDSNMYSQLMIAHANLDESIYQLAHTTVRAPTAGHISELFLKPGDYAKKGVPVFAVVDNQTWWVVARFKESALRFLKPNKSVLIWLRANPWHLYHGVITGTVWGVNLKQNSSEAANSVLPYVKRTENWVQLEQRFPTRIIITDTTKSFPLRVGMTARVILRK